MRIAEGYRGYGPKNNTNNIVQVNKNTAFGMRGRARRGICTSINRGDPAEVSTSKGTKTKFRNSSRT
jgi:hypothetical protein